MNFFEQLLRDFDFTIDHVPMDFDIAWALLGPYGARYFMQLLGRIARISDDARRTGDFLIYAVLRFYLARLMMNQGAKFALLFAGPARKNQQRNAFRE